jgi:hypothetical protein
MVDAVPFIEELRHAHEQLRCMTRLCLTSPNLHARTKQAPFSDAALPRRSAPLKSFTKQRARRFTADCTLLACRLLEPCISLLAACVFHARIMLFASRAPASLFMASSRLLRIKMIAR